MSTLLASAPSLDAIQVAIRKFYCGTEMNLSSADETVWSIARVSDGKQLTGVQVRKVGKRYRFEMTI